MRTRSRWRGLLAWALVAIAILSNFLRSGPVAHVESPYSLGLGLLSVLSLFIALRVGKDGRRVRVAKRRQRAGSSP
jgi:hypothetical protein